jgi:hypothetical protein
LAKTLGLDGNDALWSIVTALDYYDSLWWQYPARFCRTTRSDEPNHGLISA